MLFSVMARFINCFVDKDAGGEDCGCECEVERVSGGRYVLVRRVWLGR